MAPGEPHVVPREITEAEVAAFHEHGWVWLPRLIDEAAAARLLARAQTYTGVDGRTAHYPSTETTRHHPTWTVHAGLAVDLRTGAVRDPLFFGFSHAPSMGRIATRLLGAPARFWVDQAFVKAPAGDDDTAETRWHADLGARVESPFLPAIQASLWMALSEVTPDHGSMRFVSPRQAERPEVRALFRGRPVAETYADLDRLGALSPPLHLRPGDATIHGAATFHSAPPNQRATPRWSYVASVFPAHATFSGAHAWPSNGVAGLTPGEPFPDARFRVLEG